MQFAKKPHIFICTLTLCIVLFLVPLTTKAQTIRIPDVNLRTAIHEALGIASNARITAADMRTLRELRAENRDIKSLKGLEAATNLERLFLNHNSISNISPLTKLTKLNHLSIRNNKISDISPLSGLVNMTLLNITLNQISDLSPVAELINLRNIDIGENLVSDISPLAGLIKLEWVGTGENPVADLTHLSGLINLQGYHSWGTPILNLSALAELPKLRDINICGGGLSDISTLAEITSLRELYLAGNEISDISALANLKGLSRLNLAHNEVSDVSALEGLKALKWIDLGENTISDVSPLRGLDSLTWLDLSENRITDVSELAALRSLTWIGLHGNAIADESVLERFSGTTSILYTDFVSSVMPPAGPKIQGPWLWVIVPGAGVGTTDLLSKMSGGAATEVKVSTFGAKAGKRVGDSEWTAHPLAPTGYRNLFEMGEALGWASGAEIYGQVVYGSVTLDVPRKQETTMLVGSSDGVKVWLNGELVHYNVVLRGVEDYQDAFPVTLKRGANVLLVAVDNRRNDGAFSGFFGFAQKTTYTVNPPETKIVVKLPVYDVNEDGITNVLDLILVGQDLGKTNAAAANARTDVNGDGKRDIKDLILVANHAGDISGIAGAPSAFAIGNMRIDPGIIRTWITHAQLEDDGSLVFQQGITNLQRFLALLTPESTVLLANYPNPFNPETWIPYQLAKSAKVTLRIYATNGALVRRWDIGHQPAGIYEQRSRAAYWDGKNALGEPVASGVYFYTLTAGDFSMTRRMLIRK